MRTKALRLHHRQRIASKVRKYNNPFATHKTRKPCSCPMCGHVRQWNGPTLQELKAMA